MPPTPIQRFAKRFALAAAVLATLALAPAAGAATTTTFGADLSQPPNTSYDCTVIPGYPAGAIPVSPRPSSCTWATATGSATDPSAGMITPSGTGTITTVRVRVGAISGPMRLEVLRLSQPTPSGPPFNTQPETSCCTDVFQGSVFTPTPNSVTTLPVDIPVHTDPPGEPSQPGLEVGDMLGLSILEDGVPIPAIDEISSGLPENQQPTSSVNFPAMSPNETNDMGGVIGYQLDMNADWVPTSAPPPITPTPINPTPPAALTPTLKLGAGGTGAAAIKGSHARVDLACGKGTACKGTMAIESLPLPGATTASAAKARAIIYASGSFSLAAGASKAVSVPLTSKGKAAAHQRKRLKVYIDITIASGSTTRKISHRLKLRF